MAVEQYIKQPCGVGVRRELRICEREHVICLLRVIERLPDLSTLHAFDRESLQRQLQAIHQNHLDLAKAATDFLTPPTG